MSDKLAGQLEQVVLDDEHPRRQRLHAMWSLMGGGYHDLAFHLDLLRHKDPTFRAWGVRSLGNQRKVNEGVLKEVEALAKDPSPDVRLQVAIAARKIEGLDALPLLVQVLANSGDDKLIPHIVWQNLHPLLEEKGPQFLAEVKKYDLKASPGLGAIMPRATERILAKKRD
jgi:hypothetical protein